MTPQRLPHLLIALIALHFSAGCGGSCTYDTLDGDYVVTAVEAPGEACCADEMHVTYVFLQEGETTDDPTWGFDACIENARITAEGIQTGATYPGTIDHIDRGTCSPYLDNSVPAALSPSETLCMG